MPFKEVPTKLTANKNLKKHKKFNRIQKKNLVMGISPIRSKRGKTIIFLAFLNATNLRLKLHLTLEKIKIFFYKENTYVKRCCIH